MILRSGCSPSREYATGAAVESPETRNFTLQAQRSGPTWQVEMTESTDSQTEERSERRRNGEEATWLVDRCPRRAYSLQRPPSAGARTAKLARAIRAFPFRLRCP